MHSNTSHGDAIGRSFILAAGVDDGEAFLIESNRQVDGLAADLTIFDVLLATHRRVDDNLQRLAAIRTVNLHRFRRIHGLECQREDEGDQGNHGPG